MFSSARSILRLILFLLLSIWLGGVAQAVTCDVDADNDIDRDDLNLIQQAILKRLPVSGSGDPRDADSNGVINSIDGRLCALKCTRPACATNSRPIANAGPDQTVRVRDTVILNGAASADPDGNPLTFLWSFLNRPTGSFAVLSSPTGIAPTFVVDKPGYYQLQLVVNDGLANSVPDTVTISTENSRPIANAGPDQSAPVNTQVFLDGSASSDVDGDMLSYHWNFLSRPTGSLARLDDATVVNPSFLIDKPGVYEVHLVVGDGALFSLGDTVRITTVNSPPVAQAGPDQNVPLGSRVHLDASASSDVDGDTLSFLWSLTSRPAGSVASLSATNVINPSFLADRPGSYIAQLIVSDGTVSSAPDTVTITTLNAAPVASAGPDQHVPLEAVVNLDGSASTDPEGALLSYTWSLLSRPAGSTATLTNTQTAFPEFIADKPGIYVVQLIVSDGEFNSAPDTVVITTDNTRPVANAGPDGEATIGQPYQLDGSASRDADGDPLSYDWSLIFRPTGSTAALSDPTAISPSFTPDLLGSYLAQLIVSDGLLNSEPDTVLITARYTNQAPVAVIEANVLSTTVGSAIQLSGTKSRDPEGDPLTYEWTVTTRPAGSTVELAAPTSATGSFTPDAPGIYTISLVVRDARNTASQPATVTIEATMALVTVPDVVGRTQAQAAAAIVSSNLTLGSLSQAYSNTVPQGSVVSQIPAAGLSVAYGTAVDLIVSLGPTLPPSGTLSVGPEGGTLQFPNGIVLEVPAGAVNQTVDITLTDLPCASFQDPQSSQQLTTRNWRCLRGFSAKPDGLRFNVPIKALVPVQLNPGDIPVPMAVDPGTSVPSMEKTNLVYRGAQHVVALSLTHFSEKWLVAFANAIVQTCKKYETYMSDLCGSALTEPNPWFNNLQVGACWLPKQEREAHGLENVVCCMEQVIEVEVTEVDFTAGGCAIVGGVVNVTFSSCPGSPTETNSEAATANCPADARYTLDVVGAPWIYACQSTRLEAKMSAMTRDGKVLFEDALFPATWEVISGGGYVELGADVPPNGKEVMGIRTGEATIRASAVGAADKYFGDYTLKVNELMPEIFPGEDFSLHVGQSRELWVPCVTCPHPMNWSTDNPGVLQLEVLPGDAVRVTAIERGSARIFARSSDFCGKPIEDTLTVQVTKPEVSVTPAQATIAVGTTIPLSATVVDGEGCTLAWYSNDLDVASVNSDGVVMAMGRGVANISAVCGEAIGLAVITVTKTQVIVSPAEATISVGGEQQLSANVIDGEGCRLRWYSNNTGVATVSPDGKVKAVSPGVANISAVCGEAVGVSVIKVVRPRFLVTWSGTRSDHTQQRCIYANGPWSYDIKETWSWTGTATIEGYAKVVDLSTEAIFTRNTKREYTFTYSPSCIDHGLEVVSTVWAPDDKGIQEIKKELTIYITEKDGVKFMADPLLGAACISPEGVMSDTIESSGTCSPYYSYDSWSHITPYPLCIRNSMSGHLTADDPAQTSFSKTEEYEATYKSDYDCGYGVLGTKDESTYIFWSIRVIQLQ